VDARERWQALQRRLGAARRSLELGDRDQALVEVDAALALDPEFLAAQALRDRILADGPAQRLVPPPDDVAPPLELDLPLRPAAPPPISETGYAKFEQRAKRRRVDRRLDAARTAIDNGRLHEAGAALDEVLELDPNTPELAALTAALDDLRRTRRSPRHGAWLAAALVFGATVLGGASWLENQHVLLSRPIQAPSALVAPPQAPELPADAAPGDVVTDSIGTSGRAAVTPSAPEAVSTMLHAVMPPPASLTPVPQGPLVPLRDIVRPDPAPAPASSSPLSSPSSSFAPPPDTSAAPPPPPAGDVPSAAPAAGVPSAAPAAVVPAMMPAAVPTVDETALVKQALQRYRAAYDGLDAGSAQAVWPAVDQGALARAFDGLESQTLTFDACDVQLQNDIATATCRGTARYVPKIGSREPRVEPRVWSFSLRKNGGEWKIDTARVDR
jgi:tetratricopeptide (TPR) repeat protein